MEGPEQGSAMQYRERTQTSPAASESALHYFLVEFGPLQHSIGNGKWMTELDRIQVLEIENHEESTIWFRLIGPGCSMNLQLNAPQTDLNLQLDAPRMYFFKGTMTATTEPIPEEYEDLIEVRVNNRGCAFVDVYVILRQHGLDEWTFFPGGSAGDRCIGFKSWKEWILACLTPLFDLEDTVTGAGPSFPTSDERYMRHDLLEKCLPMKAEWKSYSSWRLRQLVEMYIHDLGLTEYEGWRSDTRGSGQVDVNVNGTGEAVNLAGSGQQSAKDSIPVLSLKEAAVRRCEKGRPCLIHVHLPAPTPWTLANLLVTDKISPIVPSPPLFSKWEFGRQR
ncbi:hypothetical protein Q7P37_009864 [Cladosporium fusiforme]